MLEILTLLAIIVAIIVPYINHYLTNKPKKSKLKVLGYKIINQDNGENIYYIGRLILKNEGRFIAKLVEPYIHEIKSENIKEYFFPAPLQWTHGQLNKINSSIRNIYPNQVVYLDLFDYYTNQKIAKFIVTAGKGLNNIERLSLGKNSILISLYQESGQRDDILVEIIWKDINRVPEIESIKQI